MKDMDVNAFRDEFELIHPGDLPDPAIECKVHEISNHMSMLMVDKMQMRDLMVQKEADMWAESFKKAQMDPNSEFDV